MIFREIHNTIYSATVISFIYVENSYLKVHLRTRKHPVFIISSITKRELDTIIITQVHEN
jgi:hypothetical protein